MITLLYVTVLHMVFHIPLNGWGVLFTALVDASGQVGASERRKEMRDLQARFDRNAIALTAYRVKVDVVIRSMRLMAQLKTGNPELAEQHPIVKELREARKEGGAA